MQNIQNREFLVGKGGWFVVASSILFLAASLVLYRHTQHFVQTANRTRGMVTKLVHSRKAYFPVYTFKDSQGKAHSIESLSGSYPADYQVGDTVAVLYQPDQPDNAEIDTFVDVWIWPMALAGIGIFNLLFWFVVFRVVVFLQQRRPNHS